MGHFLKACSVANDVLSAIYDVMATCNISQDERDSLFTAQSVYLLKLMSCLEPPFMETYLRPSDKSNLVSEVFSINEKMISKVSIIDTKNAEEFLENLHIDENGNLIGTLNIQSKTSHDILLNHHSNSTRGKSKEEVLTELREKLSTLKDDVQQNLISNLQDQNSEQSWYWNWSGLDLTIFLLLDQHISRLLEVIRLYTTKSMSILKQNMQMTNIKMLNMTYGRAIQFTCITSHL